MPFVIPPQQLVSLVVAWNTNSPNFVSPAAITSAAQQPLVDYINSINAGESINVLQMNNIFQTAVASIIPTKYLSRLVISVAINSVATPVDTGTGLVDGDPESYFYTTPALVMINRG